MKKLLASDVDGTLFVNNEVHTKSIEYLKEFRKNGHVLLLCTGRNLGGVKHLINNFDVEADGFVLCNGSVLLDKELNLIHSEEIEDNIIKRVFKECKDNNLYNFYFADSEYMHIIEGYNDNPMISAADITKDMQVKIIKEEDFYSNTYTANTIGVEVKNKSIKDSKEKIEKLEAIIGDRTSLYRNQNFIDIAPKNCSKSEGIAKILHRYEVDEDNVYVIGDSWNDLSMFKNYKNSYTFTYAEEELKQHANNVVEAFYYCLEGIL